MAELTNLINCPVPGSPRFEHDTAMAIARIRAALGPSGAPSFSGVSLSDLTASRLVYTDADKVLSPAATGTSLSFSAGTLNTIQDIRTTDSPTFAGLTLVNSVTEFSTDGTLAGNSDAAVPTEKAVKTYVAATGHAAVTLGTANGLSLAGQELSLPTTATPTLASLTLGETGATTGQVFTSYGTLSTQAAAFTLRFTSNNAYDSAQNAMDIRLLAGYAGSTRSTNCLEFYNEAAGTRNNYAIGSGFGWRPNGNRGAGGYCIGDGGAINVGLLGLGAWATSFSAGVVGSATIAKDSAKNVGVFGTAENTGTSGIHAGGYFALYNTAALPTIVSGALVANNAASTDPIFVGLDNGTPVFTIADGGAVTATGAISATGLTVSSNTPNQVVYEASDSYFREEITAYKTGITLPPQLSMRKAEGTKSSPSAVLAAEFLFDFLGYGYGATGWGSGATVRLIGHAGENWTDAAQGSYWTFSATPVGSTSRVVVACVTGDGRLGVNTGGAVNSTVPMTNVLAQLHVDQPSTTAAIPVALLDQADVDQPFIKFIGTAASATLTNSLVAAADVTTATVAGYVKVEVRDDGNQITDQTYYMPVYTLA